MLEEAISLSSRGHVVHIVMANEREKKRIYSELIGRPFRENIIVETPDCKNWDWERMTSPHSSSHIDEIYLIDHYVVESRFSRLLDALHRYDRETPELAMQTSIDDTSTLDKALEEKTEVDQLVTEMEAQLERDCQQELVPFEDLEQ
jgi:hypothetical protein